MLLQSLPYSGQVELPPSLPVLGLLPVLSLPSLPCQTTPGASNLYLRTLFLLPPLAWRSAAAVFPGLGGCEYVGS